MWYRKIIRCTGESLMYIMLSYLNATSCPSIFMLLNHLGGSCNSPHSHQLSLSPTCPYRGIFNLRPFLLQSFGAKDRGWQSPPAAEHPQVTQWDAHAPDVFTTWFYTCVKQNITAPCQKNTATGRGRSVTIPKRDSSLPAVLLGPGITNPVSVNFSVSLANSAHLKKIVWQSIRSEIKMRTH